MEYIKCAIGHCFGFCFFGLYIVCGIVFVKKFCIVGEYYLLYMARRSTIDKCFSSFSLLSYHIIATHLVWCKSNC